MKGIAVATTLALAIVVPAHARNRGAGMTLCRDWKASDNESVVQWILGYQTAREWQTGTNLAADNQAVVDAIASTCARYPAMTVFDVMTVVQPLQKGK